MISLLIESHILEDVNKCIIALRDQDADNLDRAAGAIRGRAARVAHIVTGEMDSYEPGTYTEGVMRHVNFLTSTGKFGPPKQLHFPDIWIYIVTLCLYVGKEVFRRYWLF